MSLVDRILGRADTEQVVTDAAGALAAQVLSWASQPYHARFMKWLEDEIMRPADPDKDVTDQAIRADTLKQVRARILNLIAAAEEAAAREEEEARNA